MTNTSTRTHTFATPEPLTLNVRNVAGDVRVLAAEVTETTVEITPRGGTGADAVDDTRVELSADGRRLDVEAPERRFGLSHKLSITVTVPVGSTVDARTASADITCRGRLGGLEANTASGDVSAEDVDADVSVNSASGSLTFGAVAGSLETKTASGDIRAASVGGSARLTSASGDLTLASCEGEFTARTASGDIQLGRAGRGGVQANTMSGDVRVGIRPGARVWLDVSTLSGRTRSDLDHDDAAQDGADDEPVVSVAIRTVSGDVTLSRGAA